MKTIGLDIGTTTVCGIVMEAEDGRVLATKTLANDTVIKTKDDFAKCQDVERIMDLCNEIVEGMLATYEDIVAIGVSGQMHGILYVDAKGHAVSPLYSWQDERGNQPYDEQQSYSAYLSEATGYEMATGYGLTTHFYNYKNGAIPKDAVCICTIGDYVAMHLAEKSQPIMHKSMAASLGIFNIKRGSWELEIIESLGMNVAHLPVVSPQEGTYGENAKGMQVSFALGDNQASFLGSVGRESNILVNVGTGSQISIFTKEYDESVDIEYRPFVDGTYLMVGAVLCGGASYAMLRTFYENVLTLFGCEIPKQFYEIMNQAANSVYEQEDVLKIDACFNGTRSNPEQRGSIQNINSENFAPETLTLAMLRGMCDTLYKIFEKVPVQAKGARIIVGSGNGIRQNPVLQRVIETAFAKTLHIPIFSEEASCGAALHALYCSGIVKDFEKIRMLVRTKQTIL
jgi:Sugar (pentulose and hexulose) kinases